MSNKSGQSDFFAEEESSGESVRTSSTHTLSVLVPYPVGRAYDYSVPETLSLEIGDYVTVPFGGREVAGVIWGEGAGDVKPEKLKPVLYKHPLRPMPKVQRDFIEWVARYCVAPLGSVLKMSLSVPAGLTPLKPAVGYQISPPPHPSPRRGEGDAAQTRRVGGQKYRPKPPEHLINRAQEMRCEPTDAEKKMWQSINREQLGVKFRRQHPVDPYIVDFVCLERCLVIEVDGGQHSSEKDQARTAYLEENGFTVLRFWNNEVLENIEGVLLQITERLQAVPLPRGGKKLTPQQKKVLAVLTDGRPRIAADIAEKAGCSASVVKGLADKGFIERVDIHSPYPCKGPDINRPGAALSEDQDAVASRLKSYITPPSPAGRGLGGGGKIEHPHPNPPPQGGRDSKRGEFYACLLDGVTGAGKTETYFEAVAQALKQDKQVLILLPEIALSNAFLDRFEARFGCPPALWHSHLSPGQRHKTWRGVAEGKSKVVVGARSALFLPFKDIGLIIVDEEHDPAYKQEDGVIYHARDMAVVRAKLGGFPIALVSATPSLETMHNAWQGRYEHLHLPDRYGGARLPEVNLIDMRAEKLDASHFIATPLREAIKETITRGEQALLFLNRRGYAPLTICRACGHRMECPRCTAWLVEHKKGGRLQCHHCGFNVSPPKTCPECTAEDSLVACGPGVERVFEEMRAHFPDARIALLASDTAEDHETLKSMLEDIREHKVDIIIGTQIIAKGHHFPHLTLVGVVDADLGLTGGELRAAERTYQLLHQVAGRAGREEKPGRVYLQTFAPDHKIMKALEGGARNTFLEAEAHEREIAHMPPYSRLVAIIIAGRDEEQVIEVAKELGRTAPQGMNKEGHQVATFGPAPAPFAKLRGRYRYRLLVQADKAIDIQKTVASWVGGVKVPSTVRVYIDIDPQSFL